MVVAALKAHPHRDGYCDGEGVDDEESADGVTRSQQAHQRGQNGPHHHHHQAGETAGRGGFPPPTTRSRRTSTGGPTRARHRVSSKSL
jgi:hypothetical protein